MKSFTIYTCCQFGLSLLAIILFTSVIVSAESNTCREVDMDFNENADFNTLTSDMYSETSAVCGDDDCKRQGLQSGNLNENGTFGSSSGGKRYRAQYKKRASAATLEGNIKRQAYQHCRDAVADKCADFKNMCGIGNKKNCKRDSSPSGPHMTLVELNKRPESSSSAYSHTSTVKCSGYCGC